MMNIEQKTIPTLPKVAILTKSLLPISETFIKSQANGLKNFTPIFVGQTKVTPSIDISNYLSFTTRETNTNIGRIKDTISYWFEFSNTKTYSLLQAQECTLFHVHFATNLIYYYPTLKKFRKPILVTLHGYDITTKKSWWESGSGGSRMRSYPKRLLEIAKDPNVIFIAVSSYIKQKAIDFGLPEGRILIFHIGVDLDKFIPTTTPLKERSRNIVFIGRMVEKKSPTIILSALEKIERTTPNLTIDFIGDGPLIHEAIFAARKLKSKINFHGALPHPEVINILQQAMIFCLPSKTANNGDSEGLPISTLEALACGIPVVTSATGTQDLIKQEVNGLNFKECDIDALANSLKRIIELCESGSLNTKTIRDSIISKFDLTKCTAKLENLYLSLTQPKNVKPK